MKAGVASTVLGKRKLPGHGDLVLRLEAGSSSTNRVTARRPNNHYDPSDQQASTSKDLPMMINGTLVVNTKNCYHCTFKGCDKAYTKPSRLEEHERSHTGQRPFICDTCGNSYLRETHLHAHARSHLPAQSRPFVCEKEDCGKRFWTSQHLKTHESWHNGAKPYECNAEDCHAAFAKHHQLRAHICTEHSPPGTKPYACEHEGCSKSFDTNQHLKTHQKTHNEKRYTCIHASCLAKADDSPPYFVTWSALQSHIRTNHPPTCLHPSCNGRTFANYSNLRAHVKLHEQREMDEGMTTGSDSGSESESHARKRRRGGEYGRDWKCDAVGCIKEFKSKKALDTHMKVTHLGKRDFVCHYANCSQSFGYKHLLQRHEAKVHHPNGSSIINVQEVISGKEFDVPFDIDSITGNAYAKRAEANVNSSKALRCPFPSLQDLIGTADYNAPLASNPQPCGYVFNRGYDLRRHLKACHDVVVVKEVMDRWVRRQKEAVSLKPHATSRLDGCVHD